MKMLAIIGSVSAVALTTLLSALSPSPNRRGGLVPDAGFGAPEDCPITLGPVRCVVVNGKVRGRDPDPFIRQQICRGDQLGGSQDLIATQAWHAARHTAGQRCCSRTARSAGSAPLAAFTTVSPAEPASLCTR